MSFSFQCPVCKSIREAADHVFGKRVRCADCDNFVIVNDSTIVHSSHQSSGSLLDDDADSNPYAVATPESFELDEPLEPVEMDPKLPGVAQPLPGQSGTAPSTNLQANAKQPDSKQSANGGRQISGGQRKGKRDVWKSESSSGDGMNHQDPPNGTDDGGDGFEAVELAKKKSRTDDEMDMTPMVDVTFLLLIFFMVTASFVIQMSMDLPTKQQDEPSPNVVEDFEDNPEYVSVFVSPLNEYRIRTSEYDWEDAPNRHELRVKLSDALEAPSKPEKMLIMAHADCFHDKVIQAMDIGIELQYKIQVIMTEDEF
jgi:biopolymer transport protein ExbD